MESTNLSSEGRLQLAKMMLEIEHNELLRSYDVNSAVGYYFDHLRPFVKMLGKESEIDLDAAMDQLRNGKIESDALLRSQTLLQKAMELSA